MTVVEASVPSGTGPSNSSGITVIVVGLGLGGLATAIECLRKGHAVIAFDKIPIQENYHGDAIGISTNAARVVSKWGDGTIHKTLDSLSNAISANIYDMAGDFVLPADMTGFQKNDGYWVLRGKLATLLFDHAKSLGADLRTGPDCAVEDYWETEDEAGVIVHGERIAGDCVICSDGIGSVGRSIVCEEDSSPIMTDEYVWRTAFETEKLASDPLASWIIQDAIDGDQGKLFKGKGFEFGFSSFGGGKQIALVVIFNIRFARDKLGKLPESPDDLVPLMEGWPLQSKFAAVLPYLPDHKIVHHPITLRSPMKSWISRGGRMMVIGDAAHPLLPLIGQGGTQAVEDGAVIAAALDMSGKQNVRLGLQVAEMIRLPRATKVQESSQMVHSNWYNQDWEAVRRNPSLAKDARPLWILDHDCEKHTYQEYGKIVQALRSGRDYVPTNIPSVGEPLLLKRSTVTTKRETPRFMD